MACLYSSLRTLLVTRFRPVSKPDRYNSFSCNNWSTDWSCVDDLVSYNRGTSKKGQRGDEGPKCLKGFQRHHCDWTSFQEETRERLSANYHCGRLMKKVRMRPEMKCVVCGFVQETFDSSTYMVSLPS